MLWPGMLNNDSTRSLEETKELWQISSTSLFSSKESRRGMRGEDSILRSTPI
jgi:hypothetical protein